MATETVDGAITGSGTPFRGCVGAVPVLGAAQGGREKRWMRLKKTGAIDHDIRARPFVMRAAAADWSEVAPVLENPQVTGYGAIDGFFLSLLALSPCLSKTCCSDNGAH